MFSSPTTFASPELHLILLALVGVAVLESAIAIWAATSRRHWFGRALVIWAAVTLLLPIRAWQPALVFALSSPLTIAILIAARRFSARDFADPNDQAANQPRAALRFRLSTLFLLLLLFGLSLSSLLYLFRHSPALAWTQIAIPAAILTALTTLSYFTIVGPRRWLFSGILLAAIAVSPWLLWPRVKWLYGFSELGLSFYDSLLSSPETYRAALVATLLALGEFSLLLLTLTFAIGASRRAIHSPTNARRLLFLALAPFAAALAFLYWHMLWFAPLPPAPISGENNFAAITQIAQRVKELNGNSQSLADLRATGQDNARAAELELLYDQLLPLLNAQSSIPLTLADCTNEFFSGPAIDRIQSCRALSRALQAETRSAAALGDLPRAARFTQANLRLGSMLTRGGLLIDHLVGHSVLSTHAAHELSTIRHKLDPQTIRPLLVELRQVEAGLEPWNRIVDRDWAFCQRAFGWSGHLEGTIRGLTRGPPQNWETFIGSDNGINRMLAINHLLQIDLALRLFQHDHNRLPTDLAELAPTYLPEIPLDNLSGRPLIYRPAENTFVLYSVGDDCLDNGGNFTNRRTFYSQPGYDLDLDTFTRP